MRPLFEIATISAIFIAGIGTIRWLAARTKRDPAEAERRRRSRVGREGRLVDGFVTDVVGSSVVYSYAVAGVEYQVAQDLVGLCEVDAAAFDSLIGPVTIRYLPGNPSNSVVLTEDWSGFRTKSFRILSKGAD